MLFYYTLLLICYYHYSPIEINSLDDYMTEVTIFIAATSYFKLV